MVFSRREAPKIMEAASNGGPKKSEKEVSLPGTVMPSRPKQKAVTDDRELINEMKKYKEPLLWETLQPTAGVVLREKGKEKQGPIFSTGLSANSTMNTFKVTKTEYQDNMRSGVIVRGGGDRSNSQPQVKTEHLEVPLKTISPIKQSGGLKKKFTFLPPLDLQEQKPEITVHSSRLLDTLMNPNESTAQLSAFSSRTDRQLLSTKSVSKAGIKSSEDLTMKMNTVDEFNMHILHASDWGKQANVNNTHQNPLTLPKLRRHGPNLGFKLKLPRERDFRRSGVHTPASPLSSLRESKTKDFF